ncbi:hypothetical protein GHT07_18970 [Caenimonas koreensis DSM 17982]|uniref:Uncharacterized protein n=1 Tax=Caenimonas koreensis DSM 17982 TaxID=1121255 RepID=A0A844B879_9BURK|nr:hypothetical protein [Caenimonas koreensis]MRD49363.1 hypothetical protein [Caenimonas koreensis DSM 17982]
MFVKVCLGYDGGVPTPGHGEQRPLFGQLYSDKVRHVDVLLLWPLDFATNTRASTTTKPLATLWRPTLSTVMVNEMSFGGFERVQLASRRRWMIQRWRCEPMTYQDAKRREAECKAEKWRWA